ncbi:hypothetical protein [Litoribacter populi]|uniref:hypothetical protein n=1 Tax=Litoribacter populi TaxID=2598460 RepID=UPI00117D980F|nr:hypothetical protein [Litoribacter populi]
MARQSSFIKLEGTMGDVTFFKGPNGYHARQKGGISKSRIMNDPNFERTRENLAEFARAAAAGKMLKDAFREITLRARDIKTHNRLYSTSLKVLKSDLVSDRGERKVENGDMSQFVGFQFSNNCMYEATIYVDHGIQQEMDEVIVAFDEFVPKKHIAMPAGATDFRLFLVGTGVDFESRTHSTRVVSSGVYKLGNEEVSDLMLTVSRIEDKPFQFYGIGIEFLQEINGKQYVLNNGAHNAAKLILASGS